ncbi:hypothetical protein KVT40_008986 [Elsinoe batatas]|uniref:Uncharacterized protein n=1 Tax=Elsinoe batatas TaxID=2601811 RepID=A0A8K0KY39_9PEZI|nr:hypothetical protein KVT40_008986 [Elsinoe batatas]
MSLRASYPSHGTELVEEPFLRAALTIIVAWMAIFGEALLSAVPRRCPARKRVGPLIRTW